MSRVIDIISISLETYIYVSCCNLFLDRKIDSAKKRITLFLFFNFLHMTIECAGMNFSFALSLLLDFIYVSVLYLGDLKTKLLIFGLFDLMILGLESILITILLYIEPSWSIQDIVSDEVLAPVMMILLRMAQYTCFLFLYFIQKKNNEKEKYPWVSVVAVINGSLFILWVVYPELIVTHRLLAPYLVAIVMLLLANNVILFLRYRAVQNNQFLSARHEIELLVQEKKIDALLQPVKVIHNQRNHTQYLLSALQNGEHDRAYQYLLQIDDSLHIYDDSMEITGNLDIDLLLHQLMQTASESQIPLNVYGKLPQSLPFRIFDIILLMSNAVENALAHVKTLRGNPSIVLRVAFVRNRFSMEVTNPYRETHPRIDHGFYAANTGKGGFGLDIMGNVVKRYDGAMLVKTEKNTFRLSVFLPAPEKK